MNKKVRSIYILFGNNLDMDLVIKLNKLLCGII